MNKYFKNNKYFSLLNYIIEYSILGLAFFLALNQDIASGFLLTGTLAYLIKLSCFKDVKFKYSIVDLPIALLVVFSAISILVSVDKFFSFYNCYNLLGRYVLTYYLLVQNIENIHQVKKVIAAILLSAVGVISYGFYQYFHGIDVTQFRWVDDQQFPELKTRVFSTLQNPNILAGYLLMVSALCFGLLWKIKELFWKGLFGFIFLFSTICLLFTYCRGAWLSLGIVLLLYCGKQNKKILVVGITVIALFLFFNVDFTARLLSVFNANDTSSMMRLALWESTLYMIRDNIFTGIGWGTYWLVYPQYDYFIQDSSVKVVHAHNMYLNFAAEIGIFGLLSFLGFSFSHLKIGITNNKHSDDFLQGLNLGLVFILVITLLNGFTDYVLFNIELSMFFWLFSALTMILQKMR